MRERRNKTFVLLLAVLALYSTDLRAERGTFGLLELEGGFVSSPYADPAGSFGYGLLLGVGGKFKKWRPVFYLTGFVNNSRYWHNSRYGVTGEDYSLVLNLTDLGLGIRIVVPVVKGLRIYLDVAGLRSYQVARLEKGADFDRASSGWVWGAMVGEGIEYRWRKFFGTGIEVEGTFYQDLGSSMPQIVGIGRKGEGKVFAGLVLTFYF